MNPVRKHIHAWQDAVVRSRTGWPNGTYMSSSTQRYNAAGRLVYDSSRHLCTVNYNTLGLPTLKSPATTSISSSPRKERVYDAHGNKIRQTDIEVTGPAGPKVIADRRYIGSFVLNCDTLERVNFGAGYLEGVSLIIAKKMSHITNF